VRDSVYAQCKAWQKKHGPDPEKIMEEYRVGADTLPLSYVTVIFNGSQ